MRFGIALACLLASSAAAAPFKGESCQACHARVRDAVKPAVLPPAQFLGDYDVAVVGGGLAGLTAAHYLKGLKVVVLEKEDRPGGKTRREKFDRWSYSVGAVYTAKPYGMIQSLLKELGIYPAKFRAPVHEYWTGKGLVREWLSEETLPELARTPQEREELKKFALALKEFGASEDVAIPIQDSKKEALAEYDGQSFSDYLLKNFGARAAELGDHYARDVFGAGARDVSAAVSLAYMSSELSEAYGWPGGLGAIAEALQKELGKAVKTRAWVEDVISSGPHVRVIYRQGSQRYEVRAKAAVIAVPSMIARRIVSGLSPEKLKAMAAVRYSSYAVIAMQFKKPVHQGAFVLWTPGLSFSDLTFPGGDRLEGPASSRSGQVAAAYMPLGSSEGRQWLLARSDEEIEKQVREDLDKVLPGASREIETVNIIRWGHAMPILAPGHLSGLGPRLREPDGRLFFAGVDTQVPAIEGAMYSGYQAAEQALRFLKKGF